MECTLIQATTVFPDDFLAEDNNAFVVDAYAETNDCHKRYLAIITNVWIHK